MEYDGEGDEHDRDDRDGSQHIGGQEVEEGRVPDLARRDDRSRVIDDERQPPVHRQGAERDDQHGEAQAYREDAVEQAEERSESDAQRCSNEWVDTIADGERADDRREVEHPPDGEIDLPHRQQKDHPEREDADEGVAGGEVEQVVGIDKCRLERPDHADEQAEGDDDAKFLGEPAAPVRRIRSWQQPVGRLAHLGQAAPTGSAHRCARPSAAPPAAPSPVLSRHRPHGRCPPTRMLQVD